MSRSLAEIAAELRDVIRALLLSIPASNSEEALANTLNYVVLVGLLDELDAAIAEAEAQHDATEHNVALLLRLVDGIVREAHPAAAESAPSRPLRP